VGLKGPLGKVRLHEGLVSLLVIKTGRISYDRPCPLTLQSGRRLTLRYTAGPILSLVNNIYPRHNNNYYSMMLGLEEIECSRQCGIRGKVPEWWPGC